MEDARDVPPVAERVEGDDAPAAPAAETAMDAEPTVAENDNGAEPARNAAEEEEEEVVVEEAEAPPPRLMITKMVS